MFKAFNSELQMSGLPDRVANGPSSSEHIGKDAQIWERPWSLEEMRQSSDNWSLAADSGVSYKKENGGSLSPLFK